MVRLVLMKVTTNDKIVGIVDDEIDITELFQDALRGNIEGISVVSFNDPSLALEHYIKNKENYVLILSDMRMPTMSGLELLKKVKELNPHIRTILVSAYNMQVNSLFQTYLKEGAIDSVIEKPVTINRFCQKVRDEGQAYQLVLNKQK